jgi:hypothetical protein
MQSDFEINADFDEPLQRGRPAEEDEERVERELIRAAQSEFREPVTLPGDPGS